MQKQLKMTISIRSKNTKWTQKGHIYLYKVLKRHGVYPSIEKIIWGEMHE